MPGTIETALQAIAGAHKKLKPPAYSLQVKSVRRALIEPESLPGQDIPAVFVIRPPGSSGTIVPLGEAAYLETLRVQIFAYVRTQTGRNPEDDGLATRAEAALADLKRLQMADPTYGTRFIKNSVQREDMNDAAFDETGAMVGLALDVIVAYDTNQTPP